MVCVVFLDPGEDDTARILATHGPLPSRQELAILVKGFDSPYECYLISRS